MIVVAWLALGALVATGCSGDDPSAGAASDLLDAIRRSHDATFRAEGTYERTTAGGATQTDELVVVQRPPDRIALGYGSWDGVVDSTGVHCTRDGLDGAWLDCQATVAPDGEPAVTDLTDLQAGQLDEVEDLVTGDEALYLVAHDGDGCFLMSLVGATRFVPAYGQRTRWCFDEATGATSLRRVEHADATDLTRYDRISGGVDDADFPPKSSIRPVDVPMGDP